MRRGLVMFVSMPNMQRNFSRISGVFDRKIEMAGILSLSCHYHLFKKFEGNGDNTLKKQFDFQLRYVLLVVREVQKNQDRTLKNIV